MDRRILSATGFFIVALFILTGCRSQEASTSGGNLEIQMSVEDLTIGETTVLVTVKDESGDPISDAKINLRGDMSHAGMVPVIRDVEGGADGVYTVPFEWAMGGDWLVEVTVTLPDGESAKDRFAYTIAGDASPDTSHESEESNHTGGTSAAYMMITNQGDSDDALVRVEAEFAGSAGIHQTVVDANDVARMEPVERLVLPRGESVTLGPGGVHVMMLDMQRGLKIGNSVNLRLIFASGTELEVIAIVREMPPDDSRKFVKNWIVVEGAWARPVAAGIGDQEMDMTEETGE